VTRADLTIEAPVPDDMQSLMTAAELHVRADSWR